MSIGLLEPSRKYWTKPVALEIRPYLMPDADWIFRVASRPEVGGGHVSRCRALALVLRQHAQIAFLLDSDGERWIDGLERDGFEVRCVGDADPIPCAGCVLDSYELTAKEIAGWRTVSKRLVVIDDSGAPPAEADLAVSVGLDPGTSFVGSVPVLAGPRYALLDPVFCGASSPEGSDPCRRILLGFGLIDSRNAMGLALDSLSLLRESGLDLTATLAMSKGSQHFDVIKSRVTSLEWALLNDGGSSLLPLFQASDLMVGGGGVTMLERLAAGLPSVTVALAKNQEAQVQHMARRGATVNAGALDGLSAKQLADHIGGLATDQGRRREMTATAREIVDGRGPQRVTIRLLDLFDSVGSSYTRVPL